MAIPTWLWLVGAGVVAAGAAVASGRPKRANPEGADAERPSDWPTTTGSEPPPAGWGTREEVTTFYSGTFRMVNDKTAEADIPEIPIPSAGALVAAGAPAGPIIMGVALIADHLNKTLRDLVKALTSTRNTSSAGEWRLIATRRSEGAYAEATVTWGNVDGGELFGACAEREFRGVRTVSGALPLVYDGDVREGVTATSKPYPGPLADYCRTGKPDFQGKWLMPAGPPLPELQLVVEGDTTGLLLWMPGRGDHWWYRVTYRWRNP